jgi:hypothetical protein
VPHDDETDALRGIDQLEPALDRLRGLLAAAFLTSAQGPEIDAGGSEGDGEPTGDAGQREH